MHSTLSKPNSKSSVRLLHGDLASPQEPCDRTGSSFSCHDSGPREDTPRVGDDHDSEPITLGLAIRRTRLVVFTATMLMIIIGFTVWLHHGVALSHFDSRDKNATEQTKLLDDYNSYSGNVATIFATPVELFVTVAVQVIVLRFMADTFTRPEMSWKVSGITLLLGAGVGYMISNGFNALNVQLRPESIRRVISLADLGVQDGVYAENISVTELAPHNPITNTILSNAVQTTYVPDTVCADSFLQSGVNSINGTVDEVGHSFLHLGFTQRDWQTRLLPEALSSDKLRLIVNPTNTTINDGVDPSTLPMKAETAAMLFHYTMTTGTYFFPWGKFRDYVNTSEIIDRYPMNDSGTYNLTDSLPRMHALLPPDIDASETAQREFFIQAVLAAAPRQFAKANRTKTTDVPVEFSHTQIAPNITFDAVSWEFEVDPELLATYSLKSEDNTSTTRYTVLDQLYNCPGGGDCIVRKPSYRSVEPQYDAPAQVVAFRFCLNSDGNETMDAVAIVRNNTVVRVGSNCFFGGNTSSPSLMIVSVGKRLVADALEQNVSMSVSGTRVFSNDSAIATNLRKIYSFTVGRLGWQLGDLGSQFSAECDAGRGVECQGLELPLAAPVRDSSTVRTGANQRLVLGKAAIRDALLGAGAPGIRISYAKKELLALNEPPHMPTASSLYETMAGDLLLPHNVRNVTWDETFKHPSCDYEVEGRIKFLRSQHHYMEHSLQPAYTSALFYLFQKAVVRDVIVLSPNTQSLAFEGNSQAIAVWVSTPSQNMWLTIGGCLVLVVGLLGAMIKSTWFVARQGDALAHITEPHAIARVMMDERRYPPLFLRRNVVERDHDMVGTVDDFAIAALSLQQQRQHQRRECLQPQKQQQDGRQQRHDCDDLEVAFV